MKTERKKKKKKRKKRRWLKRIIITTVFKMMIIRRRKRKRKSKRIGKIERNRRRWRGRRKRNRTTRWKNEKKRKIKKSEKKDMMHKKKSLVRLSTRQFLPAPLCDSVFDLLPHEELHADVSVNPSIRNNQIRFTDILSWSRIPPRSSSPSSCPPGFRILDRWSCVLPLGTFDGNCNSSGLDHEWSRVERVTLDW